MYTHIYTHACARTHTQCAHTHVQTYACMQTHTHTHIHSTSVKWNNLRTTDYTPCSFIWCDESCCGATANERNTHLVFRWLRKVLSSASTLKRNYPPCHSWTPQGRLSFMDSTRSAVMPVHWKGTTHLVIHGLHKVGCKSAMPVQCKGTTHLVNVIHGP